MGTITYLADVKDIFEDWSVGLHHHDVLGHVGIKELFGLHLACLDDNDNLSLDLIKSGDVRAERHCICARWVNEDVSLVEVAPELLQNVPMKQQGISQMNNQGK